MNSFIYTLWTLECALMPSAAQLFWCVLYVVVCVRVCVCVFVPAFVCVYNSPHPPFHSTTQEKEDEAEKQGSPNRNYY